MKLVLLTTALVAAIPAAFGLTIDSPTNIVACEPTLLSWSGGTAPYFLTLLPAGQTTATPLENLGTQQGTSLSWNVNFSQGVGFTIALKDSTGATAYSSIVTVSGGGPSCNTTATGSGSSSSSNSVSGGSSNSSGAASTPGSSASTGATATSGGSGSGSTTTAASSSSSTQRSSAGRITTSSALGVAGVMSLVGAMLF